jgi:tetratricopeptide (TPR) repeat protein
MLAGVWAFLLDLTNREVLRWIGGGLVALAGGIWTVFKFLAGKRETGNSSKESGNSSKTKMVLAHHGGIAAGGNVTLGALTQNYGLDSEAVEQRLLKPVQEAVAAIRIELAAVRGIDPATLLPLFEHLGHRDLPLEEIRQRAEEAIAQMIALSKRRVEPSNDGADIDVVIGAARQKLAKLDTDGARSLLHAKIVEEEQTYRRRLDSLLTEQATIELMSFDYDSAQTTLKQLVQVEPDSLFGWLSLGDVFNKLGLLHDAQNTYQSAVEAAERLQDERDLAIALLKSGETRRARGDLDAAKKYYQQALYIIHDRAMRMDDPIRQHDLSVCLDKMGDLQAAQGDYEGALKSYTESLAIGNRLRKFQPENVQWQHDLVVSYDRFGCLQEAQGDSKGAAEHYDKALVIARHLSRSAQKNVQWSAELAFLLRQIGGLQEAEGDASGALKRYREALSILHDLSESQPKNVEWQHDKLALLEHIAELEQAE